MIATGTGMSPIKSMLMHLLDTRSKRKIRLFFGVRHESDLFYTDLFRGLSSRNPEFSYDITLSSPNPQTWAGLRGRVTDLIEKKIQPADAETTEVYLCGGIQMIEDCRSHLQAKGFPDSVIHHENFY
jgi:NAD(P)H-flavin reductase